MLMKFVRLMTLMLAVMGIAGVVVPAGAQEEEKPYKISEDGTVDWTPTAVSAGTTPTAMSAMDRMAWAVRSARR